MLNGACRFLDVLNVDLPEAYAFCAQPALRAPRREAMILQRGHVSHINVSHETFMQQQGRGRLGELKRPHFLNTRKFLDFTENILTHVLIDLDKGYGTGGCGIPAKVEIRNVYFRIT